MFNYTEDNLYDRCGAIDSHYDSDIHPESTGKFVEVGGEKIPLINFNFRSGSKFTRCICLKTFLGYIPIENITCFKDIFDKHKYLHDETEWVFPYDKNSTSEKNKNDVKKLSLVLGKHWK